MANDPSVENLGGDKEGKSNIYLVDPNPPGRGSISSEDLFMYVKLRAIRKNRSVIETDGGSSNVNIKQASGTDGEINFIATRVDKDSTNTNISNDGNSYATTDWTNIGGIKGDSKGMLEGFGITNINVSYGASLVPQVDIDFTDLRGSSLFNVIDKENRESPYSIFFSMPYPIFELTIKGYFGKAVTYCLHMLKWDSDFDGTTGNFKIKAKFVGFQQAFLNDMLLQNIVGVVNTNVGADALSRLQIEDEYGGSKPTPKLDDFINQISKVDDYVKEIKGESDSFESLKTLNTEINHLQKMRSFIGRPIETIKSDDANPSGDRSIEKASTKITSDGLGYDGLIEGIDYVIIRDLLVMKLQRREEFKSFIRKSFSLYTDFLTHLKSKEKPNELPKFAFNVNEDDEEEYLEKIFYTAFVTSNPLRQFNFLNFYTTFLVPTDEILKDKEIWGNVFDYSVINESVGNFLGPGKFTNDGDDIVFVMDLFPMRNEIENLYQSKQNDLEDLQKDSLEELNIKLSKKIDFNPTIKNVVSVIANNTQAMLTSLYDVSRKAENLKESRAKALEVYDAETDIDVEKSKGIYAWPDIIQVKAQNGKESTWLGDVIPIDDPNRNLFPEIAFIEEVLDGYLTSTNRINNDSEISSRGTIKRNSNGWLPISPLDYASDPYLGLNKTNNWVVKNSKGIPESLMVELVDRVLLMTSYSKYNDNIVNLATLDGAYAGFNTLDESYANTIIFNLDSEDIINYLVVNDIITPIDDVGNYYKEEIQNGSFKLDGLPSSEVSYLFIQDHFTNKTGSEILNKNTPINTKISNDKKTSKTITKILTSYQQKDTTKGNKYHQFDNKLPYHNISYLVWGSKINDSVKPKGGATLSDLVDNRTNLNFDIKVLDNVEPGSGNNEFIGKLNNDQKNIIRSEIYSGQTSEESKALLLLNTLPFDNPNKVIPLLGDIAKIVKLPKYYLLWLCGSMWRYSESAGVLSSDPILWSNSDSDFELSQPSTSSFLYNVGTNKVYDKDKSVEREIPSILLTLPAETEKVMISYFKSWVESGFPKFESLVDNYQESLNVNDVKEPTELLGQLGVITNLVSTTPNLWNESLNGNILQSADLDTYVTYFTENFRKFWVDRHDKTENVSENDDGNNDVLSTTNNSDLKASYYIYFKNIYDKWIGGTQNGKIFNVCGPSDDEELINYFKFISRSWCDIGDKAVVNLNSVASLSNNYDQNVYYYLGKILRDSNFLLQILPTFVNFKDAQEVTDMFRPITNVDKNNRSSGPIYACIYAGGNSRSLELTNGDYKGDGFNMNANEVPEEFTGCDKPHDPDGDAYNLVAFRVAFGSENQSIFKSLSLNQEEHRETGESIRATAELVDNRGGSKRKYQGTDLYPIFQTRSYKCKVEALGCMNIQPMMYFQLDNVPFFKGAYLITNVTHAITPNHITTSFQGLRQTSVSVPIVDTATTFLNIKLDESIDIATADLSPPNRELAPFGVDSPELGFTFGTVSVASLTRIGVPSEVAASITNEDGENSFFQQTLLKFDIKTNAEVTMFLSQIFYEGNNLKANDDFRFVEVWNNPTPDDEGVPTNGTPTQLAYGKSNNKLGNNEPGDGYRYLGRGFMRILGKNDYIKADADATLKKILLTEFNFTDSLLNNPFILEIEAKAALASACWFWKDRKINDVIEKGTSAEFVQTTSLINPNDVKNMGERYDMFEKILDALNLKDIFNL